MKVIQFILAIEGYNPNVSRIYWKFRVPTQQLGRKESHVSARKNETNDRSEQFAEEALMPWIMYCMWLRWNIR